MEGQRETHSTSRAKDRRRWRMLATALAFGLLVVSCASGEPATQSVVVETATTGTTGAVASETTSAAVSSDIHGVQVVTAGGDTIDVTVDIVDAAAVGVGRFADAIGPVYDIGAPADAEGPFTLRLPTATDLPDRELIAWWSDEMSMWIPVDTIVDGKTLVANVEHLSIWGSIQYRVGRLTGTRSAKPECDAPPEWANPINTVQDDNAELFACGETNAADQLVLQIVNNRDYGVWVDINTPWAESPDVDVPWEIWTAFLQAAEPTGGDRQLYMTGGSSATVTFNRPQQTINVEAYARRDVGAVLAYLLFELLEAAGGDLPVGGGKTLGVESIQCYLDTVDATWTTADGVAELGADQIIAGIGGFTGCLDGLVTRALSDPTVVGTQAAKLAAALAVLVGLKTAKYANVAADLLINDRVGTEADLVDISVLMKHDRESIEFPMWRIPVQGQFSSVVYVGFAPVDAEDPTALMEEAHSRLADIGLDLWPGSGGLSCDFGAIEALGGPDGTTLGVYFDTPDEAHRFADAWLRYFGEEPYGIVDEVQSFCLD